MSVMDVLDRELKKNFIPINPPRDFIKSVYVSHRSSSLLAFNEQNYIEQCSSTYTWYSSSLVFLRLSRSLYSLPFSLSLCLFFSLTVTHSLLILVNSNITVEPPQHHHHHHRATSTSFKAIPLGTIFFF